MANEINMYAGNNRTLRVTVTDANGAAYDLTATTLYFYVKKNPNATAVITKSSAVASQIAVVAPATNGIFEVYLVPADTSSLEGQYIYDLTLVSGTNTYTIAKSIIDINVPVK